MISIRNATRADYLEIAKLQTESWRDAYAEILPKSYLENQIGKDMVARWTSVELEKDDLLLVAGDGHRLVGFAAIWVRPEPFIDNLHVKPAMRSKGVGRRLLGHAASVLLEKGHKNAYLWVMAENRRAIAFYENLGGKTTAREMRDYFGNQALNLKIEWGDLNRLKECAEQQP